MRSISSGATLPRSAIRSKIGAGVQVVRSIDGRQPGRQHPGQVGGQPAAGDVRERVDLDRSGQGQAVEGVDPGRRQQVLAERLAELRASSRARAG